jgi:hypothetical protein
MSSTINSNILVFNAVVHQAKAWFKIIFAIIPLASATTRNTSLASTHPAGVAPEVRAKFKHTRALSALKSIPH